VELFSYFLGAFKQAMGRTPHRYLTEQRIARACERLQDPHRSITEVAFYVGFSSQSHLTSVFRRYTKTTPAAYRDEVLGLRRTAEDPMIFGSVRDERRLSSENDGPPGIVRIVIRLYTLKEDPD
jgi:AraC-like DNA-binding protein